MGIHVHLDNEASFEPEAIQEMGCAFEKACIALRVFAGDEHGRRIIATRIIALARKGVIDADALAKRVIGEGNLSGR
jgi:hypothetical protein